MDITIIEAPQWPGYTLVAATTAHNAPLALMQRDGSIFGVARVAHEWALLEKNSHNEWVEVHGFHDVNTAKACCDGMDPTLNSEGYRVVL